MRKRRPKFVQFIPEVVPSMFTVVEETPGLNYWHAKITDAIAGDCPEFRYTPPKKGCPFTIQELANSVAGQLNEARGHFTLQEFQNGIPVFTSIWISNGSQVMCYRTSDETRQPKVDFEAARKWLREATDRWITRTTLDARAEIEGRL